MTTWLREQRLADVREVVRRCGARTMLDLGCGNGDLLTQLITEPRIEQIVGVDVCRDALGHLRERLNVLGGDGPATVDLSHGSMTEIGAVLVGFDCAILIETIAHIDPDRLSAPERAVLFVVRPATVVITTPNAALNPLPGVPSHRFRHPDHRFEWDRPRFQ